MGDISIKVEGLSKHYRLGKGPSGRGDFREAVTSTLRHVKRRVWDRGRVRKRRNSRDLWALRDVNFEVKKGEVVGIIGHNGAGKSTLLKILSRITDPTSGEAWFEGRVGSLLEVGTGFHPELSGRENVFLSGAILGMKRREIAAKFDEIVGFAEMDRFIDTPVKRYSSGMYVRLGFAVAANLDPDVLIIDEVLAVGDSRFQRRCMDKMRDVSQDGRTILFVSHNMGSVLTLCSRALVMKQGRLVSQGSPADAAALYLKSMMEPNAIGIAERTDRRGGGRARAISLAVYPEGREDLAGIAIYGQTAVIRCEVNRLLPNMACQFTIVNHLMQRVCRLTSRVSVADDRVHDGKAFICELPELTLMPGNYQVNVGIHSGAETEDAVYGAATFEIQSGALAGRPLAPYLKGMVVTPRQRWIVPRFNA